MKKNYRIYLERAARQTILIHRPDTLIKLILRTIIHTLHLEYAGMFIYDKNYKAYVLKFVKGLGRLKIPVGFLKITTQNPLVRYFTDPKIKLPKEHILLSKVLKLLYSKKIQRDKFLNNFLQDLKNTLSLYGAYACIAGFFREELIGILLLGRKVNKRPITKEELGFLSVLASDVVMSIKNAYLIEDLNRQLEANKRLFLQTVLALASSIEAKDKYTIGHTERVEKYSLIIAEGLRRYVKQDWEKFKENLKIAALLHDIGKIGIPEGILNKYKPLTDKERLTIEKHTIIGAEILSKIEEFKDVILGVKYHHERYDGKGYPYRLEGKKIPLIAGIIALADSFDAMTIDRPYRRALKFKDAILEIKRNKKKQFLPIVVDSFIKNLSKIEQVYLDNKYNLQNEKSSASTYF